MYLKWKGVSWNARSLSFDGIISHAVALCCILKIKILPVFGLLMQGAWRHSVHYVMFASLAASIHKTNHVGIIILTLVKNRCKKICTAFLTNSNLTQLSGTELKLFPPCFFWCGSCNFSTTVSVSLATYMSVWKYS